MSCVILERHSCFQPSSEINAQRYLKLVKLSNSCLFTLIALWMPLVLFVTSFVFSALVSFSYRFRRGSLKSANLPAAIEEAQEENCREQSEHKSWFSVKDICSRHQNFICLLGEQDTQKNVVSNWFVCIYS